MTKMPITYTHGPKVPGETAPDGPDPLDPDEREPEQPMPDGPSDPLGVRSE